MNPSSFSWKVQWHGKEYFFTAIQSDAVEILWEAWERGTAEVGGNYILETIDSDSKQLKDVFKGHEAWGAMIQPGRTKGSFRLAEGGSQKKIKKPSV